VHFDKTFDEDTRRQLLDNGTIQHISPASAAASDSGVQLIASVMLRSNRSDTVMSIHCTQAARCYMSPDIERCTWRGVALSATSHHITNAAAAAAAALAQFAL